jgi:hypothetical protein
MRIQRMLMKVGTNARPTAKTEAIAYPQHPEYSQRPADPNRRIAPSPRHGGVTTIRRRRPT